MKIEHIAIWTADLERLKHFYETYFDAKASSLYNNPKTGFASYFLSFDEGCRLEIMQLPTLTMLRDADFLGLAHFAVQVGNKAEVSALTERLRQEGYVIAGEPRTTGDGYFESVVLDPDGNRVELTAS